jgi:hypothetical protein
VTAFLGASLACFGSTDTQSSSEAIGGTQPEQRAVLKRNLGEALDSTDMAVRIYFSGACHKPDGYALLLPNVRIHSPGKDKTGFEAIQEMFAGDPDVAVSKDRPGIVTIKIRRISTDVLDAKIPMLVFSKNAQYNAMGPGSAIGVITGTGEYKAALTRMKAENLETLQGGLATLPSETSPHLPPSIKDTTIDEALDLVAKTFDGVVIYGECQEPNGEKLIDVEFISLRPFPDTKSKK